MERVDRAIGKLRGQGAGDCCYPEDRDEDKICSPREGRYVFHFPDQHDEVAIARLSLKCEASAASQAIGLMQLANGLRRVIIAGRVLVLSPIPGPDGVTFGRSLRLALSLGDKTRVAECPLPLFYRELS